MLRFRLFQIPVEIQPTFFLVAVFLGLGSPFGATGVAVWVAVVLASILLHELGHALTARSFGATVSITLYALGGYTAWSASRQVGPGRRALVAAAGSGVEIVAGLLVLLAARAGVFAGSSELVRFAVTIVIWVNLGWALINWIPVRQLDGGHILESLLELWLPRRGPAIAAYVFPAAALLALGATLMLGLYFAAALAGWVAFDEVRRFGTDRGRRRDVGLEDLEQAAARAHQAGDRHEVVRLGSEILERARSEEMRTRGFEWLVRGRLLEGKLDEAVRLIDAPPAGVTPSAQLVERTYLQAGRHREAEQALRQRLGSGDTTAFRPLTALLVQQAEFRRAAELVLGPKGATAPTEVLLAVQAAAHRAGAEEEARVLGEAVLARHGEEGLEAASALLWAGRPEEAVRLLRPMHAAGDDGAVAGRLAEALAETGDLESAAEMVRHPAVAPADALVVQAAAVRARALREAEDIGRWVVDHSADGAGEVRAVALYNIGCARSLQGDTRGALRALRDAVDAGFRPVRQLETDPDLAPLRQLAEFRALLLRVAPG